MAQNSPKMLTDPHFDRAAGFGGSLATIFGHFEAYFEPFWAYFAPFGSKLVEMAPNERTQNRWTHKSASACEWNVIN